MNVEEELLKLLKKMKRKNRKHEGSKEKNFTCDMCQFDDDTFSSDLYMVKDVVHDSATIKDVANKYKNVYNNFENDINFYLSEYVEDVIYSSVKTKKKKNYNIQMGEETFNKPSSIIYQHLNYGNLIGEKLRCYEFSSRYFTTALDENDSW
ncbi:hypothetical protein, conserved [Plasmodium gonderi]|uniref:Uncharacterized protein n=1 Tax=Plasmodium gonderi TaxID=77519 RepID=A0A1Y1JQR4_PLAGO|nr:hypothetical protein, conserved [Plasmodium gonderi]GAW83855.1 hypothetical protein, conserved [Plasmodium gonderi]